VLLWLLRGRLGGLEGRRVAVALMKILVASVAMGLAAHAVSGWMAGVLPGSNSILKAVRLAIAITAGVAVLVAAARVLRIAEFDDAFARVLRRLRPAG
jgi:peptidoglycan biosynthesis protein MviN/MurJ (putative lipid II flippase)